MKDWRSPSGLFEDLTTGNKPRNNGQGLNPFEDPVRVVDYMEVPKPEDVKGEESGKEPMDVLAASDWSGNPAESTDVAYGPANTGREHYKNGGSY